MIYRKIDRIDVEISVLGLGGHEYLPDGRSRGFNEDAALAIRPGYFFEGFGQEKRVRVLATAFEHGINFFDVTQDSEKEALGRNLKEVTPPYEIYIQTRPEGMVYSYDEYNVKMADYELLKAEVQRGLRLLQRDRLDFFNVAFMQAALDHDPEYLDKIRHNVERLKAEGLIRFACADTFSGESTYLQQIASGCFDAVFINVNLADDCGRYRVLPAASERGLGVLCREAFMKGALFKMGEEVGLTDRNRLAQIAFKWNLSDEHVTSVIVGVDNAGQLVNTLQVLDDLELNDEERDAIERIKGAPTYKAYAERKREQFGYPPRRMVSSQ
jgi:aryl-alcohol dehydrogenase-like predicted oxidoreductase